MKICAIVAEFNIFHSGHAYLLNQIRLKGYSHIVVIMSGNFVQRGDAAIISKRARVKAALRSGADLVIELPTAKVVATAEKYAFSAVKLINCLGCVDAIAFGSESGSLKKLKTIKNALQDASFGEIIKENLKSGTTFSVARSRAVSKILNLPEIEKDIKMPNNILAIEYLKALDALNSNILPLTIKRFENSEKYLSASKLRELIFKNDESYKNYVPQVSRNMIEEEIKYQRAPVDFFSSDRAVIPKLRSLSLEEISRLPDISEGIENRIYKSIKNACSVREIIFKAKTKRYSLSRIRRIILCAFLGINSEIAAMPPKYIRILGTREKGLDILKKIKLFAKLPIVSKYSDALKFSKTLFDLESQYTDLYHSLTPKIFPCGLEKQFKLIKDDIIDL